MYKYALDSTQFENRKIYSLQKKVKNLQKIKMKFNIFLLILTTLAAVALTSPLSSTNSVSKKLIANDFATSLHGKMDQDKIDAAVNFILKTSTAYHATGSVICGIFYLKFQISITGGKTFNGDAGGACFPPGAGAILGDVYTDDRERLYRDTVSFEFNAAAVYLNVNFFDRNSNLLGHLQSGAVSLISGVGGGTGRWS